MERQARRLERWRVHPAACVPRRRLRDQDAQQEPALSDDADLPHDADAGQLLAAPHDLVSLHLLDTGRVRMDSVWKSHFMRCSAAVRTASTASWCSLTKIGGGPFSFPSKYILSVSRCICDHLNAVR